MCLYGLYIISSIAVILHRQGSSNAPGTSPDWHCSVYGILTQELDCSDLALSNYFSWGGINELNYTNTYAYTNTSVGADSAWTNLYDDIDALGGWSSTYTNIPLTNAPNFVSLLFYDGFETGDFSNWTTNVGGFTLGAGIALCAELKTMFLDDTNEFVVLDLGQDYSSSLTFEAEIQFVEEDMTNVAPAVSVLDSNDNAILSFGIKSFGIHGYTSPYYSLDNGSNWVSTAASEDSFYLYDFIKLEVSLVGGTNGNFSVRAEDVLLISSNNVDMTQGGTNGLPHKILLGGAGNYISYSDPAGYYVLFDSVYLHENGRRVDTSSFDFYDGWESANWNNWTSTTNSPEITVSSRNTEAYAGRLNANNQSALYDFLGQESELYIQFQFRPYEDQITNGVASVLHILDDENRSLFGIGQSMESNLNFSRYYYTLDQAATWTEYSLNNYGTYTLGQENIALRFSYGYQGSFSLWLDGAMVFTTNNVDFSSFNQPDKIVLGGEEYLGSNAYTNEPQKDLRYDQFFLFLGEDYDAQDCQFDKVQEIWNDPVRPEHPLWSGGLEWNGTGWDANYRYYRYAPTIDLSALGYNSTDYRAYLYFSWQPNDYLGTGGDWPYPGFVVADNCYDVSSSLDGEIDYRDEGLFIPMKTEDFMAQKYDKPLSVTSTNYAGGWVPAAMKVLIYDLP